MILLLRSKLALFDVGIGARSDGWAEVVLLCRLPNTPFGPPFSLDGGTVLLLLCGGVTMPWLEVIDV